MEKIRVDTQQAYNQIREKIVTLALAPGAPVNAQSLADELGLGIRPVEEALKLLIHDDLVVVTPRHGLYASDVTLADLEQISEMRMTLEALSAQLAAQRATPDDLAVLDALYAAQKMTDATELFALDHKFHQAIAQAAHNKYLAQTLDRFFGLSQRLWYMALPRLDFLPAAVEEHLNLVAAIKKGEDGRAAQIMRHHVQNFYDKVRQILSD